MKFGIGRVPADVDRTGEALAELEAAELMAPPKRKMVHCDCGHTVSSGMVMCASFGRVCPDCYDLPEWCG